MQLAELSQNKSGLFYDSRIHKEFMEAEDWHLGDLEAFPSQMFNGFEFDYER